MVVLTVAVLQTAVVPVLGIIADQLHASIVATSWAVTANLLAAAAATPLIGRLADLHSKKRVLLIVLAVVLIGSVLAATTSSLALLIVGRVLQAASFALYPVGVAILREELTEGRDRLGDVGALRHAGIRWRHRAGRRGPAGEPRRQLSPRILAHHCLHRRRHRDRRARRARPAAQHHGVIDWLGAAGLAVGLSAVLLAITQGNAWGWTSVRTLASALFGIAVLIGWWLWERRIEQPLVSTTMLTRRPILLTNLATIFVGMGLYFAFLGLTQFVQIPRETAGYGFGASVLEASVVYLLPGAVTGFVVALISGRFIDRFGARPVLVVAAAAGITGFLFIALTHSAPWQVIAASVLANAYISLGYGALPALVVAEVAADETGVATSMNAIARTIGSSIAAALVAVLLARSIGGTRIPLEGGFVAIFIGGAVTAGLALVLIAVSRVRARGIDSVEARYDPRHEPRVGLTQRGEVGDRLVDL